MTILMVMAAMVAAFAPTSARAAPPDAPSVLMFQSMLFDDGGNPVPDGPLPAAFRITDAAGGVLYEEHQELEALRGQVTALVGNGLTGDGAPTGGVPASALEPSSPRYLSVEVDGQPPTAPMEIASVPYAVFANEALGAAAGAIDGEAIADGSLEFEDLSDALISRLADALADGRGGNSEVLVRGDLPSMYRDASAASSIGVASRLSYSAANDLQGVLQDLDRAIGRRDERVSAANAAIAQERVDRSAADAAEVSNRNAAISTEATNRNDAIAAAIGTEVTNRNDAIAAATSTEAANRDTAIAAAVAAEAAVREASEASINQQLTNIQAPSIPQFHVNATCTIEAWSPTNPGNRTYVCQNAALAAAVDGVGQNYIVVTFGTPLQNSQYAVIFSASSSGLEKAGNRTAGGFFVSCPGPSCNSEFIVVGHEEQ